VEQLLIRCKKLPDKAPAKTNHVWSAADPNVVKDNLRRIMDEAGHQGLNTNHLAYIDTTMHVETQWSNYEELEPAGGFEALYSFLLRARRR